MRNPIKTDDDKATETRALLSKLIDAETPGMAVAFTPDEAEQAGAFDEDALSLKDAIEGAADLLAAFPPPMALPPLERMPDGLEPVIVQLRRDR